MTVIGGDAVLLYGLDASGALVPLKLNSDGTLSATGGGAPAAHASSHDPGGSDAIVYWTDGTHAARPSASASLNGTGYYETDTGRIFLCIAAAWVQIGINPNVLSGSLQASGDTSGFSNNVFKDIMSVTFVPGTYRISANLTVLDATPTGGNGFVVLWDGVTIYSLCAESLFNTNGSYYSYAVVAEVVLGAATTISLAARFSNATGKSIPQSPDGIAISPIMTWTPIA